MHILMHIFKLIFYMHYCVYLLWIFTSSLYGKQNFTFVKLSLSMFIYAWICMHVLNMHEYALIRVGKVINGEWKNMHDGIAN